MKTLGFVRLLILTSGCLTAVGFRSTAAPLITRIDPEIGGARTEVDIAGTGFTDLERLMFTERSSGAHADAQFFLLSDTHVLTTVPSRVGSRWLISMFTSLGGTVTIPAGFFEIIGETTATQPSSVYVVREGGVLMGGGSSSTVFIESGGTYTGGGGGNLSVYVQQGATYVHGNGGNTLVFYEPGATIVPGNASGTIFEEIMNLQPSFVAVPEPSVIGLFVIGLALAAALRRSPPLRRRETR